MKITIENLVQIWKLIKPKFYNKITWLIVSCGLILIAPPLWSVILNQFIEKHTDYKIIGEYDELIGIILVLIGLIYNIYSQWISNYKPPENIIEDSTISDSNINQGSGSLTVNNNTFNIYVQDEESLRSVLETIGYSTNRTNVNFVTNSNFISQFVNLIQCLPWGKNVSKITFQNPERSLYNVIYKTSSGKDGHFYVRFHNVENENTQLSVNNDLQKFEAGIPVLDSIYWSKYKIWTLNSIENFNNVLDSKNIQLENALKNDLSVIVGDITYIISALKLELIYNLDSSDNSLPRHETYGYLVQSNLLLNGEKVALTSIEMAIIDSEINTQIIEERRDGTKSIIVESNVNTSILKLSSLMIKVLAKFDRNTGDDTTETLRMIIIELMKKIKAIHSYQIPVDCSDTSDYLYTEAFSESSVLRDYEKQKAHNNV